MRRSQASKPRSADPHLEVARGQAIDQVFESAPRAFPPVPRMRSGFEQLVTTIYDEGIDVAAEYREIERALTVRDPLNPGALKVASNKAEDVALRAYKLYVVARYEFEAYLRHTDVLVGAIREAATHCLEVEKRAGARTKQITDADVVAVCAARYGDEWEEVCSRREKARGMADTLRQLAVLAEKRSYTISRLMEPGVGRV